MKGHRTLEFLSKDQALSMFAEDRPLVSIFFIVSVILQLW